MSNSATLTASTKTSLVNKRTAYWIVTGLLALNLTGSGLGALTQQEFLVVIMKGLGYPLYVMPILGTAYILAAIALVLPQFRLVKEWAYAGVVFAMMGAFVSHASSGDGFTEYVGSLIVMSFTVASYLLRPADLRVASRTTDGSV